MRKDDKQRLVQWYGSPQGQVFASNLQGKLNPWLQSVFGYHAIQLGPLPVRDILLDSLRINHRVLADNSAQADLQCDPESLPIASDSVDILILAHTLEYVGDPHLLLREAERILVPEGRLLVVGIDSWTVWAGYQKLRQAPYRLYSQGRVKEWLTVLGFEVQHSELLSMINPSFPAWLNRSPKMARLATLLAANFAGGYALLAKKRVATLTPIEPRWKKPKLITGGLVEPAARGMKRAPKD
jgi:SAM-dependent methyltransferase